MIKYLKISKNKHTISFLLPNTLKVSLDQICFKKKWWNFFGNIVLLFAIFRKSAFQKTRIYKDLKSFVRNLSRINIVLYFLRQMFTYNVLLKCYLNFIH